MQYGRTLGAGILAGLLAACSAQNSNSTGPIPYGGTSPTGVSTVSSSTVGNELNTSAAAIGTSSQGAASTAIGYTGSVAGLESGGKFILSTSTASGKIPITVSSSTIVNNSLASLAAGRYATAIGTGTTSNLSATYVAVYTTTPPNITISGTVTGPTSFGFNVNTSAGVVPVLVDSASSVPAGATTAGTSVTVTGTGATAAGVLARTITTAGGATPTPSTDAVSGIPKHVLTGDYLYGANGSTTVTPAKAAPYLTWAQVPYANANTVHAAGIKVQTYFNPNHLGAQDPLYLSLPASAFATTCSSSRVHLDYKGELTEYQTNASSAALHTQYASYVAQRLSGQHVDAIFEDTAGPLEGYGTSTFVPGLPCGYSDSTWLAGERALEASPSIPTIFNGLSGLNGHNPSLSIGLLSNAKTIGGTYEHCFANTATSPVEGSWVWTAGENTQLQVTAKGKIFQCMAFDTASASTQVPARIYTIASFLMTYNVNYSMLQELFATPNKFHVMPEEELVALNPVVATPASVSSLLAPGGAYVRQYRSCYIAGVLKGACAMVVNPNYNAVPFPTTLSTFHHTLTLSGYDVLEGGTIGTAGAAPPRTMAAETAAVVFP